MEVPSTHDAPPNFCSLDKECIGYLTEDAIFDRLIAMRRKERTSYNYRVYVSTSNLRGVPIESDTLGMSQQLLPGWRARICMWCYNVVDHFDLSREIVSVGMSILDRFLATRGNTAYNSDFIHLASLAALHIAIKSRDSTIIRLETLASFCSGSLRPNQIIAMEEDILSRLSWLIHPPTAVSFASHFFLLLPRSVVLSLRERKEIYETSIYFAELSVGDSFFVDRPYPSEVGFAALLIALDSCTCLSSEARANYVQEVERGLGISQEKGVLYAQERLRLLIRGAFF